jgi:predicted MFS family arabinose efflux permease
LDWLTRDGKLLLTTRGVRSFGYGFLSVILAIYLNLLGFDDIMIGVVLSATLLGGASFTVFCSLYADRIGRRKMLIFLALLMAVSGVVFFLTENRILLLVASIIGTLSPTGGEVGSFLPMEQAILPQTCSQEKRNSAFATYNVVGTLSAAAGALFSGTVAILESSFGVGELESYRAMFLVYSALAIIAAGFYLTVSVKAELPAENARREERRLAPESRGIVARLSVLFGLDAFAGGFVLQSIISYWFFTRYGTPVDQLSVIFFVAGVLTTISFYAAVRLARKIGLIRTMVFTHIPSNILLMMVPLAGTFVLSMAFFLARQAISQMDVPTRQSYTMAVVAPEERTVAAGVTSISRNIAQATSPSLSGYAMQFISLSSPFFIGGSLKIVYDVTVYFNFRKVRPPEESGMK